MADLAPAYQALLDQSQGNAPTTTPPAQGGLSPAYQSLLDQANQSAAPKAPTQQPYTSSLWPMSVDAQGNPHFDPHAGILGSVIDAFTAPGDVYKGNLDPLSPQGEQRALNLATLISPVNPAVRAGDYAIPGVMNNLVRKAPQAPTAEALRASANQGYNAARATGATYPADAVAAAAQQTIDTLNNRGFIAPNAPKTHAVLQGLANPPPGGFATITGLDSARRALGKITGDNSDMAAAGQAVHSIDDFIERAGASPSMAGTPAAANAGAANGAGAGGATALADQTGVYATPASRAASLIKNARGNAAAGFRSDRIIDAKDAAELRAAAANSGQNIGNNLRQRLASLLLDDDATRGYSPQELGAIRQVVEGTAPSNTIRYVSNLLGGGGGIAQAAMSGVGALVGGHLGGGLEGAGIGAAMIPAVGAATRHAYNSAVQRQVENAAKLVRMRSPLYQQMLMNAPRVPGSYAMPSRLMRAGLLGQQPQQPNGLMP